MARCWSSRLKLLGMKPNEGRGKNWGLATWSQMSSPCSSAWLTRQKRFILCSFFFSICAENFISACVHGLQLAWMDKVPSQKFPTCFLELEEDGSVFCV